MWRFEFPQAVIYRFRDWNRRRTALVSAAGSLVFIVVGAIFAIPLLFGAALLLAGVSAVLLLRMRSLVIDRVRRLLLLEDRRPFRQTLRKVLSLDCIRLRLEMKPLRGGGDSHQSLWIEDQCGGDRLKLVERYAPLRADTDFLESDLGRPLLIVVRS